MNPETLSLPTPNHSSTSSSPLNSNPAPKDRDRDRDPKDRGDASDSKNSPETKGWLYKWTNYIKGKRNKEIIKLKKVLVVFVYESWDYLSTVVLVWPSYLAFHTYTKNNSFL